MRNSFRHLIASLAIVLGLFVVGGICVTTNFTSATNIKDEYLPMMSQNRIIFPEYCGGGGECTPYTSGDYAAVMNAKNADKSFFNGSGDVPSMQWTTSNDSMKQLLETYGDLAYQLGKAAGVPWIAVLAQATFEDPQSVCGHNNFWGNGCDPSHAYLGGADQVIGAAKNLGEGFKKYGETVHNGLYEEALKKTDPLEYLRALEGTWIGTGASYEIEGHIKALENYVETPEGKKIVDQFGNYSGNTNCGNSSAGSCAKLGELRTKMWNNASDTDKQSLMKVVSEENGTLAGVEGFMNQVVARSGGDLNKWINGLCPQFRGGASCVGGHTISEREQKWIDMALSGSNVIHSGTGNASWSVYGDAGTGGPLTCLWINSDNENGGECKDVDYSQAPFKDGGLCSAMIAAAGGDINSGWECWAWDNTAEWSSDMQSNCGTGTSNPAANSTNSNNSMVISADGLNEKAAAYLLARYALDEGGDSSKYAPDWWINDNHSNFQCAAFSAWFVNKFAKQSLTGRFVGSSAVATAVSQSGGNTSHEPEVFSLFSVPGHTGIVVGKKDDGTPITANYNGTFKGGDCNCLPISTAEYDSFKPENAYYFDGGTWNTHPYPFGVDYGYGMGGIPSFLKLDVDLDLLASYLDGVVSGGGGGGKYCNGSSSSSSSVGNGDILKAVEDVIALAQKNSSTYTGGGGHGGEEEVKAMLNGAPVDVDCTGFSTLVLYKAFGIYAEHSSHDLLNGNRTEYYEEIPRSEVKPGDLFAFHSGAGISGGHGGIVIEVNNGKITKVAEAGCSGGLACDGGGLSATNTNIAYTTTGYSINYTNSDAGHFYRFKGAN